MTTNFFGIMGDHLVHKDLCDQLQLQTSKDPIELDSKLLIPFQSMPSKRIKGSLFHSNALRKESLS
jgi:hypothetical protein